MGIPRSKVTVLITVSHPEDQAEPDKARRDHLRFMAEDLSRRLYASTDLFPASEYGLAYAVVVEHEDDFQPPKVVKAPAITKFDKGYYYLSNFYPSTVVYEGEEYPTVENAYQAAKTTNTAARHSFKSVPPGAAKAKGRRLTMRPDWEEIKVGIMLDLLKQKFAPGSALTRSLLGTGDAELIEGNTWHDQFWGVDQTGKGQNMLGQLLMAVRQELRSK